MSITRCGVSSLSFIKSISVVPPATKRVPLSEALPNACGTSVTCTSSNGRILPPVHFLTNLLNCCQDVLISAAPADIAAHKFFDVVVRGATRLIQQGHRTHDLAGSAI